MRVPMKLKKSTSREILFRIMHQLWEFITLELFLIFIAVRPNKKYPHIARVLLRENCRLQKRKISAHVLPAYVAYVAGWFLSDVSIETSYFRFFSNSVLFP